MVKNEKGGSKHKKYARKTQNADQVKRKTRLADPYEDCEMYAMVLNIYGYNNIEVLCNDGVKRLCVIRRNFSKSRNKNANRINVNTRILVGLRDWEVLNNDKKERCDLLEVYNDAELRDIMNDPRYNKQILISEDELVGNTNFKDAIIFENDEDDALINEEENKDKKNIVETNDENDELDNIDLDDI